MLFAKSIKIDAKFNKDHNYATILDAKFITILKILFFLLNTDLFLKYNFLRVKYDAKFLKDCNFTTKIVVQLQNFKVFQNIFFRIRFFNLHYGYQSTLNFV